MFFGTHCRVVGLPDGKKKIEDMCNRLDSVPACDRQTDGRTDRQISCHGIVRAMYTRRAVKTAEQRTIYSNTLIGTLAGLLHLIQTGGTWRAAAPPRPLPPVQNVTAHPSTSYYSM